MSLLSYFRREPPLSRPQNLLDTFADYVQSKSGAAQLRQQNLAEEQRRREEYQRLVDADLVGVEQWSPFFGRNTQDPDVGFQIAPADLWPGSAAVKAGLLGLGALPPLFMKGAFGYHGTPHKWAPTPDSPLGSPDLSKVGTGEGAQAYGHGFYVAEQPGVARTYKDYLTDAATRFVDKEGIGFKPYTVFNNIAKSVYRVGGATKNDAQDIAHQVLTKMRRGDSLAELEKSVLQSDVFPTNVKQRFLAAIETGKKYRTVKSEGSLYKFDIPDADINKMLDWDAPIKNQTEEVQSIIRNEIDPMLYGSRRAKQLASDPQSGTNMTGAELHQRLEEYLAGRRTRSASTQKVVSDYLASKGIPGIKYLDQQSRGFITRLQASTAGATPEALKNATRNFVIFDEDLLQRIKVLERN